MFIVFRFKSLFSYIFLEFVSYLVFLVGAFEKIVAVSGQEGFAFGSYNACISVFSIMQGYK